jgi:membrane protease YdiL (CAAX protease family)
MMQEDDRPSGSRLPGAALLLIAPAPSLGVWAAMIARADSNAGQSIFFACKLWMFLLPLLWLLLVQRGRLSLSPPRRGGFGVAALLGLIISAVIFVVYFMLGGRLIDADRVREIAEHNGIGSPLSYLAVVAYWVLVNSLLEEYAYRWFIFRQCEALMPSWLAVLGSAAVFTVHHVIALKVQFPWSATILASLGVFIGGALWSWLYLRFRSVWPCYVSHAIVDIAVFVVGWLIIFGSA